MNAKGKIIMGVMAAGVAIGGLAWATPIFNLTSPILSIGTQDADIETRGEYEPSEFKAFLKTEGPSSTVIQEAAYSPGGHNGWHSHPGIVAVTLTAGTIEWFDANCKMTTYKAGDSWTEGSQTHYFRSTSTTNIQLTAVFFIAKGSTLRIDQPAPACAAGLGLE